MDPVTDDLDWDMFSADLADGIVVSILDSFVLELPVLDFSMVQSVFEELDKILPPHEERGQQTTGKEEYFKDILFPAQTQTQESSNKISPQRKDQVEQSGEKGKCNENTVSLLQRKIKTSLGKRLAQPDDHLQQGLDEDGSQVSLSRTTLQETDARPSPKHADEVHQSISKDLTRSGSIRLCQIEKTNLYTQSNGIGKPIDKTLVHSLCLAFSNIEDNTAFTKKQLCCDKQDSHVQTKEAGRLLDNALGRFCLLAMPNVDEKELIQESRSLSRTQLCQSEGNSLVQSSETEKSALEPTTCYAPWPLEPNDVRSDITQTASCSSVLSATRKTLNEEKNNSDVRVNSTRKSNRTKRSGKEEKNRKEDQPKTTNKSNTTSLCKTRNATLLEKLHARNVKSTKRSN